VNDASGIFQADGVQSIGQGVVAGQTLVSVSEGHGIPLFEAGVMTGFVLVFIV
jgi:hypothetical protein